MIRSSNRFGACRAPVPLRRVNSLICVVVLAAGALALLPAAAHAHAAFQDARPEPGSRVDTAPRVITLAFSEPLNRDLTTARIVDARSHRAVPALVGVQRDDRLMLEPRRRLPTGPYLVDWHTVSTLDGHALEGSFGFGVRTSAVDGAQQLEQSPLARDGWLRVLVRGMFYVALFFFGGGLLCGVLLASPAGPAGWLVAGEGAKAITPDGKDPDEAAHRIWRRTRAAGWIAAVAGIGVVLAETRDAAGSLSPSAINAYLLSTASGAARVTAVVAVILAAALAGRAWRAAAGAFVVALAAVAFGGHANSASPRSLALLTDWIHLVAGTVWAGGIAQIVVAWLPRIRWLPVGQRMTVVGAVLERFGCIALPAFAVAVVAGVINAVIELGRPAELWTTSYGRVLMVKIALVAAIGAASYVHAFRLRPRVLASEGLRPAEQRLWRLLGGQPVLLVVVLVIAALLAVFPLPPRQLLERAQAERPARPAAASAAPPRPGELAVAEAAGPWIAAAWVGSSSDSVRGTVRLLDFNVHPVPATIRVAGARVRPCGFGCASFQTAGAPALLRVTAQRGRSTHTALVPVRWHPRRSAVAEQILRRAVAFIRRLRSFRIAERLASGLGGAALSRYRVQGPFRYAIVTHSTDSTETVVIGRHSWVRQPDGSWMAEPLDRPQDARVNLPWFSHRARPPRLLGLRTVGGRRVAEIALADLPLRVGTAPPFWFRLEVDADTGRVLRMRMIAPGHFMNQRYFALNVPNHVEPPPAELVR